MDDASRALAAYVARVRGGHGATKVAKALGYAGANSVTRAIAGVTSRLDRHRRALRELEREAWRTTNH